MHRMWYKSQYAVSDVMSVFRGVRCGKKAPSTLKKLAKPAAEAKKDGFMSMFDPNAPPTSNTPTVPNAELNKSKAVAVMRAKTAEQRVESSEKLEKTDDVNARLIA
ncbi:hypothetical protein MUCCIDRAFT_84234 [Mucor lusitanicus CBS 277.49]|uniref:Uncharacterized protein n=1 Tax=Mucor lusitanicus CBS 277.49 TaxID=747725 RepID=A0A162YLL2_MUCCL|nr:hypothetical protein MUCCIDRAFT_84234 [Mucor lusitanicus CBS 277.49]